MGLISPGSGVRVPPGAAQNVREAQYILPFYFTSVLAGGRRPGDFIVAVPVAQWTAHQTSNLGAAGSNPVGYCSPASSVSFLKKRYIAVFWFGRESRPAAQPRLHASIAQLAEHLPRKQKVSSSILDGGFTFIGGIFFFWAKFYCPHNQQNAAPQRSKAESKSHGRNLERGHPLKLERYRED